MMRTRSFGLLAAVVAACSLPAAVARAASPAPPDLVVSDLFTGPGHLTKLAARTAYQASVFPIAVRVTPPDASWSGAQWKANKFSPEEIEQRHLTCSTSPAVCKPPYYGWVAVGQVTRPGNVAPRGLVLIMTGYDRTPSVASTVASLRTRGHAATYAPSMPVTVAGFPGIQFDGEIVGSRHLFIPFSPRTHEATGFADGIEIDGPGHAFRFTVLNVRGKTVVILVGSVVLPSERFPGFRDEADALLKSIRFPA